MERETHVFERHFESNTFGFNTKTPEWCVYQQIAMLLVNCSLLAQLQTFILQWLTKLFLCLQTNDTVLYDPTTPDLHPSVTHETLFVPTNKRHCAILTTQWLLHAMARLSSCSMANAITSPPYFCVPRMWPNDLATITWKIITKKIVTKFELATAIINLMVLSLLTGHVISWPWPWSRITCRVFSDKYSMFVHLKTIAQEFKLLGPLFIQNS